MDREHKTIQWQKNSTAGTSDDHPNRCFLKRVGRKLQWNLSRDEMVEERTGTQHKCFRTNGCEIRNPDFHYSYTDGQQSCAIVSIENGGVGAFGEGYTQSRALKNEQVSLALSAVSWDHNYCRIFTNQIECPSRLGVSEFQGSLRLETASKHVSEHN